MSALGEGWEEMSGTPYGQHLVPAFDMEEEEEEEKAVSPWRAYWSRLLDICGWRFLVFLFFSQLVTKGMLMTVVYSSMLPLFRNQVDAATLQIYMMMAMLPWSLKPLIGLASDYILLSGYRKRGWLLVAQVVGMASATVAAFLVGSPSILLVCCFTGLQFQIALFDLLSEAKYSELRNANPSIGSDITTLVQGMHDVGSLSALLFVGFMADNGSFRVLFGLALALSASPLLPTLLGWLPEVRESSRCMALVTLEPPNTWRNELPFIGVVAFCGLSSLVVVALEETPLVGLVVSFVLLTCCLLGSWRVFPPLLTQVALFQVLTTVAQPSMSTALEYFYTANTTCLPDGPHFSYSYFIGYTGIVGRIISLAGVVLYQVALSHLRFRPVLLITTVLVALAGLSDLSMVLRFNVKLGIPDHVAYMVGEAIMEPLLGKISWIPVVALISMAVAPGREACSFAFMAGIGNFAGMQAKLSGAVIARAAQLSSCDFSALWWMVLLCHVVFPLCIGVPAVWIVPNTEQRGE
jgi:hypothetical protein